MFAEHKKKKIKLNLTIARIPRYNRAMPTTRQQLDLWKMRLLDLSRRNRLLHIRPSQAGVVALAHPAPADLFDLLVRRGRKLVVANALTPAQQLDALSWDAPATGTTMLLDKVAVPPPKPEQIATALLPAEQERALYTMRLRARTAVSEQGINVLYLALGVLEWFEPGAGETFWRSPLLLIPVELQRAGPGADYTLRRIDDDVVLNPTLAYKLRQDFGITLPALPEDIDDLDLAAFFAQIEALVAGRDGWQVAREALLGMFSFQKLLMYHDLETAGASATPHPIVEQLAGNTTAQPPATSAQPPAPNLQPPGHRCHAMPSPPAPAARPGAARSRRAAPRVDGRPPAWPPRRPRPG